jgi:hypothetical protein
MSRPDATKNALAQAYADLIDHVSLHSGDPGTTGANELGITRAAITWGSPAAGVISSTTASFTIPSGTTVVKYVGLWGSSVFRDSFGNNVTFLAGTTYTFTVRHNQT